MNAAWQRRAAGVLCDLPCDLPGTAARATPQARRTHLVALLLVHVGVGKVVVHTLVGQNLWVMSGCMVGSRRGRQQQQQQPSILALCSRGGMIGAALPCTPSQRTQQAAGSAAPVTPRRRATTPPKHQPTHAAVEYFHCCLHGGRATQLFKQRALGLHRHGAAARSSCAGWRGPARHAAGGTGACRQHDDDGC